MSEWTHTELRLETVCALEKFQLIVCCPSPSRLLLSLHGIHPTLVPPYLALYCEIDTPHG